MNEDGSLNVELIDSLPLDKHVEVTGRLTEAQIDEYFSKQPSNEDIGSVRPIYVDLTIEEELERGAVIAEDYISMMRDKLKRQ